MAEMVEDVLGTATGVFKGVGQEGKTGGVSFVVDRLGKVFRRRVQAGRVESAGTEGEQIDGNTPVQTAEVAWR
jgi:hypothetical protein